MEIASGIALFLSAVSTGMSVGATQVMERKITKLEEPATSSSTTGDDVTPTTEETEEEEGIITTPPVVQPRGSLTYRLTSAVGLENKFISIAPGAPGVVAGCRQIPYPSPGIENTGMHIVFVSNLDPISYWTYSRNISAVSTIMRWNEESGQQHNIRKALTGTPASSQHFNSFAKVRAADGGSYTTTQTPSHRYIIQRFTGTANPTLVTEFTFPFSTWRDPISLIEIANGQVALAKQCALNLMIFCAQATPSVITSAGLQILTDTIAVGIFAVPTGTDRQFYVGVVETDGSILRYLINWDGTTNAPTITTTLTPMALTFKGQSGTNVTMPLTCPTGRYLHLSDGNVLLSIKTTTGTPGFVIVNFTTDVLTDVTPEVDVSHVLGDFVFLAHDPSDDTFLLSDMRNNVLTYCQWDSANSRIVFYDRVKLNSKNLSAVIDGELVDKSAGKYVLINFVGQLFHIWVSATKKMIAFNPDLGRRVIGYVSDTGEIHSSGAVISLPSEIAANLTPGNTVFCDLEGNPTTDKLFGSHPIVGTYLGEATHKLILTLSPY